MRHVTDGELHAYLDGALDTLPRERGEEVREHLSTCSVCRERLHDETESRNRAQAILDSAVPDELSLPSFEDLKRRAQAVEEVGGVSEEEKGPRRHRGPLTGFPLAWAATVVLALGVGWMGGLIWTSVPAPARSDSVAVAGAGEEEDDRIPIIEEELSPQIRYAELESPTAPASSSADRAKGEGSEALFGVGPSMETSGLSVPGLRVLSVDWEEWAPGERALHIRQLLSPGDTLELRYLGMLMGTEPNRDRSMVGRAQAGEKSLDRLVSPSGLEASLPAGWNQVETRWGQGWLVARAPLPEASIRALLTTLR